MENNNKKTMEEEVIEGVVDDVNEGGDKKGSKKDKKSGGKGYYFKSSCCSKSSSGGGSVFGLFILFLGLFYLGKNLGWWNYQLDWTMIWPVIIIFVGLSIMGGRRVVNWLIGVALFFAIILLLVSMIANQRYSHNKMTFTQSSEKPVHFFTNYSFKKYELVGDNENRLFSGYMSREEVERDMAEALDSIYQRADEDSGKLDIEVNIRRLIKQEIE